MSITLRFPVVLAAGFLLSAAVGGFAQGERYGVVTYGGTSTPPTVYAIDPTGSVVATLGSLPTGFLPRSVVMSDDNATFRVVGYGLRSQAAIYDLTPSGLTTVYIGPPLLGPTRIMPTSDGDWLVFDVIPTIGGHLFRLNGSNITTVTTMQGSAYGVAPDPDSGQIILRGVAGSPAKSGLYRLDPKTGAVTSFWVSSSTSYLANYGAHELVVDPTSGAVIDLHYNTATAQLSRYHPEFGRLPIGSSSLSSRPLGFVRADQTGGAHVAALTVSARIVRMGRDGSILTNATVTGLPPQSPSLSLIFAIGGRHLAWRMNSAPNDRRLLIDVPGAGGKPYAVAMSLTGVRPGILIGGGREVSLVPDPLTVLCLQGGVAGLVGPTIGLLDAAGRKTVTINANPLGQAIKGTVAWVAAVVLDPAAPAGISHVLGPERIAFR